MRSGKWKYLREGTNEFLFDLSVDEREQADFGSKYPGKVKQLSEEFDRWQKELVSYPAQR